MNKHLAMVGKKNSIITGRNVGQNQTQGGEAICTEWWGSEGKEKDKRKHRLRKNLKNDMMKLYVKQRE